MPLPEGGFQTTNRNCTADVTPERFTWMTKRYPEQLRQLAPVLAEVYGTVGDRLKELQPGFDAAVAGYNSIGATNV